MHFRTDLIRRLFCHPLEFLDALDVRFFHHHFFFRKLARKGLVRFSPETNTFVRDVNGHTFHLNPKDFGLSRALALHGTREEESVRALSEHLTPDMVILDIGANIGFYVLQEAAVVSGGHGRVIAIEPAAESVRILELNVKSNDYGGVVVVHQGAVSNANGTVRLALSNHANLHKLADLYHGPLKLREVEVPSMTVEEVMRKSGLEIGDLDCLRMDVEGAEYLILPTLYARVAADRPLLMFIEFHPTLNPGGHRDVLSRLEAIGVTCLGATKDYMENGRHKRKHLPQASMRDLYSDPFLLRQGGCEAFLKRL